MLVTGTQKLAQREHTEGKDTKLSIITNINELKGDEYEEYAKNLPNWSCYRKLERRIQPLR